MISVKEAKQLIDQHIESLPLHVVPLSIAAGATLGADVVAKVDIPAFEQSSMDGYAIRFDERHLPLTIQGEMQAGTETLLTLEPGQAMRIFTGAPLPIGADTVVMQEKAEVKDGKLYVGDQNLTPGIHVRHKGSEAAAATIVMEEGCKLSPAAIGFLAGIGYTEVQVCRAPSVAIITTGKELRQPGEELSFGQVYESNSFALTAALELAQVSKINYYLADDKLDELTEVLKEALENNDVVLLTGGVSVGDYDFVLRAAANLEVEQIFHKIRQKPGKPLYFGKTKRQIVFGLPGNPSSVLSCFYQYVLPALEKMTCFKSGIMVNGKDTGSLKELEAVLTHDYEKTAGLTHFLKATYHDGLVTPLSAQESYRMSSFAQANCMIELEEEQSNFPAGSTVKVYILPE